MTRSEGVRALLLAAAGTALYLAPILFGDRCSLAFGADDPRIDLRPWARHVVGGDAQRINPATPDIDALILPGLQRARQLVERGGGPWWDEGQLLGHPFTANLPFPVSYPVAWPLEALAVDPVTQLDLLLFFHLVVALVLAYRACRWLGVDPPIASAGAIGFAFSAWMSTHWHCPQMFWVSAWWPGQLVALELVRRGRWRRGVLEGAFCTGLGMLAGFPQIAVVLSGSILLLALLDRELRAPPRLAPVAAMLAAGAALAAPQLALSSSAFEASVRSSPTTRAATAQRGLEPAALVGAVLPDFFGHPPAFAEDDAPAATMEGWLPHRLWLRQDLQNNVIENALYPGVLLLVLGVVAVGRASDARARRLMAVAGITLAAAFLLPRLAASVPQIGLVATANIKRSLALVGACVPIAGALALQAVAAGRARVPLRSAGTLLILLAALPFLALALDDPQAERFGHELRGQALRQGSLVLASVLVLVGVARRDRARSSLARRALPWLPALVLAVDLGAFGRAFNPFVTQSEAYPATRSTAALGQRAGRVAVIGGGTNLLVPGAAALHGIRSVGGVAPMISQRVVELLECIEPGLVEHRDPRMVPPFRSAAVHDHPLLDLLGVDTLVHTDPALAAATGLPVLFEDHDEALGALARPTAGPRAFRCGGAVVVPDAAARLELLASRSFPVHRTAILERPPDRALPERGEHGVHAVAVEVAHDRAGDSFTLRSDGPEAGVVVLTEAWDPGWSATLDGAAADLHVVDHALLGVVVPPGEHTVVFRYEPPGLGLGLAIGLGTLVGLVAFGVAGGRKGATHAE